MELSEQEELIERFATDREAFHSYIYTTWEDALIELDRRQKDPELLQKARALMPNGIPPSLDGKKTLAMFRHIATPNYEIARFLIGADALLDQTDPVILEYTKDKYTNRNDWKYSAGKLSFHTGLTKTNEMIVEKRTVIDINDSNFKPMHSLKTHWGQNFVEFHHEIFDAAYPMFKDAKFDLSDWLHAVGPTATDYYTTFISLFARDGILFENFMVYGKEESFTKDVILPAILAVEKATGVRPLIVPLEPTEIEGESFWHAYPSKIKGFLEGKNNSKT